MERKVLKKVGLCKGRHELPADCSGYLFPNTIEDPTDIAGMGNIVEEWYCEATKSGKLDPDDVVGIYVTGLTPALISAINVLRAKGISVILYHYDMKSGKYFSQNIW